MNARQVCDSIDQLKVADDFVDHTPQPGATPDKDGVRVLYKRLRAAFPDFHPEIHWQAAAGNLPRWTLQIRPNVDGANPAIGAGTQAGVL